MIDKKLIELLPTLPLIENPQDINESTKLEQDLKLFGYPARTFIFRYSEEFGVNISRFHFSKYFSDDTALNRIHKYFFKRRKNILTLGHLQKAINYKELNETVLTEIDSKESNNTKSNRIRLRTSYYIPSTVEGFIYTLTCIALALILAVVAIII